MKYQLVAENSVEENVLSSNVMVRPLFDAFLPLLQARSIMAGVRFGIFEAIGNEAYTADQIAQKLTLDKECLYFMLRVLINAGYISREGDNFSLTEITKKTLLSNSSMQLSNWMRYNYIQWEIITRLDDVLKTGKGINSFQIFKGTEDWEINQRAMLETARPAAPKIAEIIPVKKGAKKILDIGGAHGLYSAMICRKHPPMQAEVMELPQAIDHASRIASEEGIENIVNYRPGDALKDDLGQDFDVVFLGNITHHFTPDQNQILFEKIEAALTTHGTVAIWDFKRPEPNSDPDLVGDGLALFFRITSAAQCYTQSDYADWLNSAGFVDIKIHPTPGPSQILMTGRVK